MISSSFDVKRLDVAEKTVGYEDDGEQFEDMLAQDDGVTAKRAAIGCCIGGGIALEGAVR